MDEIIVKLEHTSKASLRAARSAKAQSLPDTYGALIHATSSAKQSKRMAGYIRKGRDELYTHRMVVSCTDPVSTEELNAAVGLHTYSYLDKIYIHSWTNPIWRHFILDNTSTEYDSVVDGKNGEKYEAHYQLKLKREVEIFFETVKNVQQFFPLEAEEAEGLVYDAFLKELLKRRSGQEFRNIVFSIQKKQGEIIASPFKQHLIVQGCAGSGKSMIMLHRLPIILYDNGQILNRSNIYIISPSVTYIEMSDNMREELEIEDLNIGTMNQYYDHVIQKYGRDPQKYGKFVTNTDPDKDILQFVYSDKLIEAIQYHMQSLLSEKAVNYTDAFESLEMSRRFPEGKSCIQMIRQEIVIAQSILAENSSRYKEYSDAIRIVLRSLSRLGNNLSIRRDAVLKGIDTKLSLEREQISKCEEELKEADENMPPAFVKGRKRLIRNARDRIIYFQEEKKRAIEDTDYFAGLEDIAGQISGINRLYTVNTGRSKKTDPSEELLYRQITNVEHLIELGDYLYRQVEGLEDVYIEYAPSIHQSLSEIEKSLRALRGTDFTVLDPAYGNSIRERVAFLQRLIGSITDDIYAAVLEDLGQKKNRRGRYDAMACSPFIYLQILYALEGPPNSTAESLLAIDEAQNLAVEELRLLKAVNKGQTVFNLYGDVHQHVEGSKGIDSWDVFSQIAQFHTYTIDENYRNARQITEHCNESFRMKMRAINLDGAGVHRMDEEKVNLYRDLNAILRKPMKSGLSCIIVQSPREAAEIKRSQNGPEKKIHDLTGAPSALYPNHWNMMTVSQAKGLEFETVVVFAGRMTENEKYIAYTRALDELYIFEHDLLQGLKSGILVNDKVLDEMSGKNLDPSAGTGRRTLRKKRTKTTKPPASGGTQDTFSVKQFFENKGIKVVDDREKSGFLWVLGTEEEIGAAVEEAVSIYGISGVYAMYGKGNVSKGKSGWYTKTKK